MAARRRIRVVVASLERFMDQLLKTITLDIVANLKQAPDTGHGTPVDTGWARNNWIPNIGGRTAETAGTREQAEAGNLDTGTSEAGVAKVAATYKMKQGPIYISNNVPYIVELNEGSSRQAARGFVQRAIVKAVQRDLPASFGGGAA